MVVLNDDGVASGPNNLLSLPDSPHGCHHQMSQNRKGVTKSVTFQPFDVDLRITATQSEFCCQQALLCIGISGEIRVGERLTAFG